ncbi:hypothetical protein [Sphingomonas sp. OTU376]|uniref:hypothetical protein n=1 Tax=Sphingomonas sp. OTU376 TaxID=3043863 RepID=UPI00313E63BB
MSGGSDLWDANEDGFWCGSCGFLVARADADQESLPDECRQCGFPDAESVAAYHLDDDDDAAEDFDLRRALVAVMRRFRAGEPPS